MAPAALRALLALHEGERGEAGREAFLSSIRTHVVEGSADGVWLDNFNQVPFNCSSGGGDCTALRSRDPVNKPSTVTAAQVAAYRQGKAAATTAATCCCGPGSPRVGGATTFADLAAMGRPHRINTAM